MGSIPLPALSLRPPQQQSDPVERYARLAQLKSMIQEQPLRQQALQQQVQSGQLDMQQRQRELDSSSAIMQSYQEANGDLSKAHELASKTGKALPSDLIKLKEADARMRVNAMEQLKAKGELALQQGNLMSDVANSVWDAPPEDRPLVYQAKLAQLQAAGVDVSKMSPQYPGDEPFNVARLALQSHKNYLDEAAKKATTQKTIADAAAKTAETDFYANPSAHPNGAPGVPVETVQMQDWLTKNPGKGASDYGVAIAGQKAAAEAKARQPYEMALAAQRQALSQGDPRAAAQLLVDGDATLGELKSRGATPDFISKTLYYAKQRSGGKYNAQQAEAEFNVAKSPANTAFFGSAKSLTDKGGTLDQLAEAGKHIPQSDITALNTLADWQKAATGNGPLAHYAATALGVADDYAKVMGGGQGSDTSRAQALRLIQTNAGPDARAGALQGIRGAVDSQVNSRIGNNSVMKRMYGTQGSSQSAGAPKDGDTKTNSHGDKIVFRNGAWTLQ